MPEVLTLSQIITNIASQFVAEDTKVHSLQEINNGFAGEFASAVCGEMPHVSLISMSSIEDVDSLGITLDSFKAYIGSGLSSHVLMEDSGRYYDAECPDGVTSPLLLPIWKRSALQAMAMEYCNVSSYGLNLLVKDIEHLERLEKPLESEPTEYYL